MADIFHKRFESETRYYVIRCRHDLFGDLVISRYWGSRCTRHGNVRHCPMSSTDDALFALGETVKARRLHGYIEVIC